MLITTSCSYDKKIGLYGFLVDDYSGDAIECIAYTEGTDNEYHIYKIFTKFGEIYVNIEYSNDEDNFEDYYIDNSISAYGQTLSSTFIFTECRKGYQSDYERISKYANYGVYFVHTEDYEEKVLHITDNNCVSNRKNVTYVNNYSEAVLLYAGMCEKCFPEMY